MQRGDGTGPMGVGPMSGRGMGTCAGYPAPGYASGAFGCGAGRGRGFRNRFFAAGRPYGFGAGGYAPYAPCVPDAAEQKTWLKNQADALENELKNIRSRLSQLENKED